MEFQKSLNKSSSTSKADYQHPSISNLKLQGRFEDLVSDDSDVEAGLPSIVPDPDFPANSQTSNDGNASDTNQTVLSLIWQNNKLGASYYHVNTRELFVMDDVYDDPANFNLLKALYAQCQPHYVLMLNGSLQAFDNAVKKLVLTGRMGDDISVFSDLSNSQACLVILPKRENNFEHCCHRVQCLQLDSEPDDINATERKTYLNAILNFKSLAMIYSLGLLLRYIDKHWNNISLQPAGKPTFTALTNIILEDIVMMEEDTYNALNIVQTKYHPSFFKFGNAATNHKGISLFDFLNRCQSRPGVEALWKMLRHPSRDINLLQRRYQVISFFMQPNHQTIVENLTSFLRHVNRSTNNVLNRYTAPHAKFCDWQRLYKTLSNVIYIADVCASHRDKIGFFAKIADNVTEDMHHIKYFLEYIVDFEKGKQQNSFLVKNGVDPQLDELRGIKDNLPRLLTEVAEKHLESLPSGASGWNMLYFPNIGYVLGITSWNKTPQSAEPILPNFEYKFTINGTMCYKCPAARELDNTIGDITLRIAKRRSQIMLKLVRYISKHAGSILSSIRLCGELDALLSLYKVARDNAYTMPNIVQEQIIAVKQGRHPLQEHLANFVSNDIYSGNGRSLIKILTGPNACGKSIYLKQVALIVFMAHIGSYVPAESATIGIVTHILTQFQSTCSIALNASTFLQDLRQINMAVRCSTPNTLIIIDEFGVGTDEISGLSLFTAVLMNFLERGVYCPHIFAATHIHRVLQLLPQSDVIENYTFEHVLNEDQSIVFLYRLIKGNVTGGFAHTVAKVAGLSEKVVERSKEVFEKLKIGELPKPLDAIQRRYMTCQHIFEKLATPGEQICMTELESWVRQAMKNSN
ncbi:mutS protein homolog 5-like [Prorops nasuta]|uniref:mutS protein homolog 5-like n=1 Tax=Prorops nasuta TaxID=863751 RepID=UPI0034CE01C1